MKQTIIFKELFSTELYTRSKATELKDCIHEDADEVEFNFSDVTFMSRSFADELYNITDSFKDKTFIYTHCNDVVETMMTKVSEGRNRERVRGFSNPKILEFKDLKSLEEYLVAL